MSDKLVRDFVASDDAGWEISETDFYAIRSDLPADVVILYSGVGGGTYTLLKRSRLQIKVKDNKKDGNNGS